MNTYSNFDDNDITTLYESSKTMRIFFTALFVTAVFIVPPAALISFFMA